MGKFVDQYQFYHHYTNTRAHQTGQIRNDPQSFPPQQTQPEITYNQHTTSQPLSSTAMYTTNYPQYQSSRSSTTSWSTQGQLDTPSTTGNFTPYYYPSVGDYTAVSLVQQGGDLKRGPNGEHILCRFFLCQIRMDPVSYCVSSGPNTPFREAFDTDYYASSEDDEIFTSRLSQGSSRS